MLRTLLSLSDWETLLGLIATGLALLSAVITMGVKLFKAGKEIVKNKDWKKVMAIADVAMTKAEAELKEGTAKLEVVLETVKAGCSEIGVNADEFIDDLKEYVEDAIKFHNDLTAAKKLQKKAEKESK